MIFITRAISMQLAMPKQPIQDFISHDLIDLTSDNFKRSNFFIRYIGYDQSQQSYIEMIKKLDSQMQGKRGYLRWDNISRQVPLTETGRYINIYENWLMNKKGTMQELYQLPFPMKFHNKMLELTQKCAFGKVMELFAISRPTANDSIKKNFGVSLLEMMAYYLPPLFGQEELICGKILYIGEIKRHELFFLYFLNLMGCDILYMNAEGDIKEKYPECERISTLYKGQYMGSVDTSVCFVQPVVNRSVTVRREAMPVRSQNEVNREAEANRGQAALQADAGRQSGKGSIHLGHHTVSAQPVRTAAAVQQPSRNQTVQQNVRRTGINLERSAPSSQRGAVQNIADQTQPAHSNGAGQRPVQQAPVRPVGGLNRPSSNKGQPQRELSYEELARLSASVVMIGIADENGQVRGSGSGVVINSNGYILTNYHVVKHGISYLVKFENEEATYETNRIIKYHPEFDLAIIKVEKRVKPIRVYEGKDIVRGQKVVAIGSPLGLFNSVSDGIVSAFRRMESGRTMIQFTAPISHGSSGGALLDLYGRLIGISTAGYDDGQNLNLAVDSECIRYFAGNYINE